MFTGASEYYNLLLLIKKKDRVMSRTKRNYYDLAERRIDTYASYLLNNIITFNEAVEDLLADPVVNTFFDKDEIEVILSFELQRGCCYQSGGTVQ